MDKKISPFQLSLLLIHGQIGVGMITLASDVHADAKTDSWISVIIGGIFIQIIIFVFGFLTKRFPNDTLFEMTINIFGKYIGKVIVFLYTIYFMFVGAILLAKYIVILKTWMMPLTPKWILAILILIVGMYAAKENLHVISRVLIIATSIIFVFLGFVIYAFKDANITYVLPMGNNGTVAILKGAFTTMLAYQGFEYMLFIAPFTLANNKQIVKTITIVNIFVTLFYTLIVLVTLLFFSSEELKLIIEPIFYLVKSFSFSIVERPDLMFTSLWVVLVVTTVIILFFIISLGLQTVFVKGTRTIYVFIAIVISFVISHFIDGEYEVNKISVIFTPIIVSFSVGFPVLLLLISYVFNKKGTK